MSDPKSRPARATNPTPSPTPEERAATIFPCMGEEYCGMGAKYPYNDGHDWECPAKDPTDIESATQQIREAESAAYERGRVEERAGIFATVSEMLSEAEGYAATHKDGWTGGQENALTRVVAAIKERETP